MKSLMNLWIDVIYQFLPTVFFPQFLGENFFRNSLLVRSYLGCKNSEHQQMAAVRFFKKIFLLPCCRHLDFCSPDIVTWLVVFPLRTNQSNLTQLFRNLFTSLYLAQSLVVSILLIWSFCRQQTVCVLPTVYSWGLSQ